MSASYELLTSDLRAAKAEIARLTEALRQTGVCMSCIFGPPEHYGCTDCANTGWNGGAPAGFVGEEAFAAANARIAEAEKVMADLDAAFTNELDLSKRSPMFVRAVKAARAWMEGKSDE